MDGIGGSQYPCSRVRRAAPRQHLRKADEGNLDATPVAPFLNTAVRLQKESEGLLLPPLVTGDAAESGEGPPLAFPVADGPGAHQDLVVELPKPV